ncbi:MAG: hypothetical protein RQ739_16400 [Desulfotignum sp.]|nr:hypothetical protein [Desulfotignum sp.]
MNLKTITVECFEGNLTPTDTVHYLEKLIRENQPGRRKDFQRLFSTDGQDEIINFSFVIETSDVSSESSDEEWSNFIGSSPVLPRMENVRQIHFDMAVEPSNKQSVVKKFHFYVENLLLFKIKSHPEDNQRLFFRIYTHPMTPEEINDTFIYDRYDSFEDHVDETYEYEGYDTDLSEDWTDSYDDYESDRFLDASMNDEDRCAPPYDEDDKEDWHLRSYACQTDFELILPTQLPQPGISSRKLLDQMEIFHDPFQVIPTHLDFFEFILQIYLVSIETLRREFCRSDFEAHLLPNISLVYRKKQEPSDDDFSGPVA